MLVLTRRPGETLKIGEDIEVCILGVTGNQVRLGTKAPLTVEVHREEVHQRIKNESGKPDLGRSSRDTAQGLP